MPVVKLDAAFVKRAVCPTGKKKVDDYDTMINSFILEVRASGGMSRALRYRDAHGRLRQSKIGDARVISFEQARKAAQTLKSQVILGQDPAQQRDTLRLPPLSGAHHV